MTQCITEAAEGFDAFLQKREPCGSIRETSCQELDEP